MAPDYIVSGVAQIMMSENQAFAIKHFQLSYANIQVARLLKHERFTSFAVFHLQQAVELAFKGLLILDRVDPKYVWQHDPLLLLEMEFRKDEKEKFQKMAKLFDEHSKMMKKDPLYTMLYDDMIGHEQLQTLISFEHHLFRHTLTRISPLLIMKLNPDVKVENLQYIYTTKFKLSEFVKKYDSKIAHFRWSEIKNLISDVSKELSKNYGVVKFTEIFKEEIDDYSLITVLAILTKPHEMSSRYLISTNNLKPEEYNNTLGIVFGFRSLADMIEEVDRRWIKKLERLLKLNIKRTKRLALKK